MAALPGILKGLFALFLVLCLWFRSLSHKEEGLNSAIPAAIQRDVSLIIIKRAQRMRNVGQAMLTIALFILYFAWFNRASVGVAFYGMVLAVVTLSAAAFIIIRRARHSIAAELQVKPLL